MIGNPPQQQVRTSWYRGAGLSADDLGSARDNEDGWTARHVAMVHDTWGVVEGLDLSIGDGVLNVSPGVAADCHGRELVLAQGRALAVPVPSDRTMIHWFEVILQPAVGAGPGSRRASVQICSAGSTDQAQPAPPLAEVVSLGVEIPLGRLVLRPGEDPAVSTGERRQVGRLTRPRIASGTAAAGSLQIAGSALQWATIVSTTSAGFTTVPEYSVWLGEHPFGPASAWAGILSSQSVETDLLDRFRRELIGPTLQVGFASATAFVLTVRMAFPARRIDRPEMAAMATMAAMDTAATSASASTSAILRTPVDIHWAGVEPRGGCESTTTFVGAVFGLLPLQPQRSVGHFLSGENQ